MPLKCESARFLELPTKTTVSHTQTLCLRAGSTFQRYHKNVSTGSPNMTIVTRLIPPEEQLLIP